MSTPPHPQVFGATPSPTPVHRPYEIEIVEKIAISADGVIGEHRINSAAAPRDSKPELAFRLTESGYAVWLWREKGEARVEMLPELTSVMETAGAHFSTDPDWCRRGYVRNVLLHWMQDAADRLGVLPK